MSAIQIPAEDAHTWPVPGCICKPPPHSGHYMYCPLNALGEVIGQPPEEAADVINATGA